MVGRSRRALTIAEVLITAILSAIVLSAALVLVNAYGIANAELNELRPLRREAVNLHAYVVDWLRNTRDIIDVTPAVDQLKVVEAGVDESGQTLIYGYMGDSPGTVLGNGVQDCEIEALLWTYTWDTVSRQFLGTLEHLSTSCLGYVPQNGTEIPEDELTIAGLASRGWLDDADRDLVSQTVYRFRAELRSPEFVAELEGTSAKFIELQIALMEFDAISTAAAGAVRVPPSYSYQVTGSPDFLVPVRKD